MSAGLRAIVQAEHALDDAGQFLRHHDAAFSSTEPGLAQLVIIQCHTKGSFHVRDRARQPQCTLRPAGLRDGKSVFGSEGFD